MNLPVACSMCANRFGDILGVGDEDDDEVDDDDDDDDDEGATRGPASAAAASGSAAGRRAVGADGRYTSTPLSASDRLRGLRSCARHVAVDAVARLHPQLPSKPLCARARFATVRRLSRADLLPIAAVIAPLQRALRRHRAASKRAPGLVAGVDFGGSSTDGDDDDEYVHRDGVAEDDDGGAGDDGASFSDRGEAGRGSGRQPGPSGFMRSASMRSDRSDRSDRSVRSDGGPAAAAAAGVRWELRWDSSVRGMHRRLGAVRFVGRLSDICALRLCLARVPGSCC